MDRGFTFIIPSAGIRWTTIELPQNARLLPDEYMRDVFAVKRGWLGQMRFTRMPSTTIDTVKQIKRRLISGVWCGRFDEKLGFHYPADGIVTFDDGSQMSNTVVAPQGIGAALYFFLGGSDQCTPFEQLADYFTIPLVDT